MADWGSKMVDMEQHDEDVVRDFPEVSTRPRGPSYPYGLRISLCDADLDKIGLDMPDVGDTIDLRAFGVVTSVSANDGEFGSSRRVEIQLQKIAVENEDEE